MPRVTVDVCISGVKFELRGVRESESELESTALNPERQDSQGSSTNSDSGSCNQFDLLVARIVRVGRVYPQRRLSSSSAAALSLRFGYIFTMPYFIYRLGKLRKSIIIFIVFHLAFVRLFIVIRIIIIQSLSCCFLFFPAIYAIDGSISPLQKPKGRQSAFACVGLLLQTSSPALFPATSGSAVQCLE